MQLLIRLRRRVAAAAMSLSRRRRASIPAVIVAAIALPSLILLGTVANATIVRFSTTLGNVDVRLYNTATPLSVANFLNYANTNRYDGTFIHRKISNFVVQGGGFTFVEPNIVDEVDADDPVLNEPGISNLRGTIAYAKIGPPEGFPPTPQTINSATNEWFFNLKDNSGPPSALDSQNGGFTVFGRVLGSGMSVIDSIAALTSYDLDGISAHTFDNVPLRSGTSLGQQLVYVNDVSVRNLPAGDYDFNGTVNFADYAVWKSTYGSTTNAAADGNGDGVVNAGDYTLWRNTLGQSTSSGSVGIAIGVPEPATGALFAAAAGWIAIFVRRRRKTSLKR